MKVALVHDHLNQFGGAERVLLNMQAIWPQSPVYTLVYDKDKLGQWFSQSNIKESFIARLPGGRSHFKWYLPLMPAAFESFNLDNYDVVVSSVSGLAKGVIVSPHALHICYCHTPTRYLWSDTHSYTEEISQPKIIKKMLPLFLSNLRVWDFYSAQRVDKIIANSHFVARRIKKYYRRDAEVIYPPVDTKDLSIATDKIGDYFLIVSRLRPYKRVDLAIKAFNTLGLKLKIIGTGEEESRLRAMAKDNIEFLGSLSDKQRNYYYAHAQALIYPQEEDFGITAVESMASGRPVIAYKSGGAVESVIDGVTGVFFEEQTWECLADAVARFRSSDFDPVSVREQALKFDTEVFRQKLKELVEREWQKFKQYNN